MAISLMLPATTIASTSSEGSPASLPPPTPLTPIEPYPPPPQTANSTTSSDNQNASTINTGVKSTAPANAVEKRKTSRRANTAERRATHNAVERQRRETLNGRFLDLAALLPNLTSVRRPSKSAIVNSSIALIHSQRRQRATAARELRTLYSQFLSLKAECDEWRVRAGVPPVEDGERSKEFIALLELREEEEMGEEERGALRMAMNATANGGASGNGAMRLDDDDEDDIIVPHVSSATDGTGSDVEQFAHQAQAQVVHQAQLQAQAQVAQVQAQAQAQAAQYHQMRARAATFSHTTQGIPSPVHGHGHHPYAAAYHSIPRPGSHGGLPPHPSHAAAAAAAAVAAHAYGPPPHHPHHGHPHGHGHGHVLPFDNGSDLILASEPHLSHGTFGSGMDIFSSTGTGPHTPGGGPHTASGLEMLYGAAAAAAGGMISSAGAGEYKNDWAAVQAAQVNHGQAPFAHPGMIPSQHSHAHPGGYNALHTFDDSASTHSSSTGTRANSHPNEGASPRSLVGGGSPIGSSSGGRSRAGSMVNGVENVSINGDVGKCVSPVTVGAVGAGVPIPVQVGVGGGGNAVMSMFF